MAAKKPKKRTTSPPAKRATPRKRPPSAKARARAEAARQRARLARAQAALDRRANLEERQRQRAEAKRLARAQAALEKRENAKERKSQRQLERQVRGMAGALAEVGRYLDAEQPQMVYRPADAQGKFRTAARWEVTLTYAEAARALELLADDRAVQRAFGDRYILWVAEAAHPYRGGRRADDREWTLNRGDAFEPACARAGAALDAAAESYGEEKELRALALYLSDEDGW